MNKTNNYLETQTIPDISIIVPIYNSEKYLEECIESILCQTFNNFELILIDDGSIDNSLNICNIYKKKDKRISVFHQKNKGVNAARKKGVENASGNWIAFIDSDDTIPTTALQVLFHETEKKHSDIIVGFFNNIHNEKSKEISPTKWREQCIKGDIILPSPCGRIFHKSLFTDWTFNIPNDLVKGEDMIMNIRLSFSTSKKTTIVFQKVYNYRQHESSCVHTFKQTPDYLRKLHHHRMLSIPYYEHNTYLEASVYHRYFELNEIYNESGGNCIWMGTPFFNELIIDKNKCKYKLNLINYIKFHVENPFIRQILWNYLRIDQFRYKYICLLKMKIKSLINIQKQS